MEVGQIKDLVFNGATHEVLYAVVAMNEAKTKDVVYVMPWTVFEPSFGQGSVIQYTTLTIPQRVWLQAPYFPMGQFRQTAYSQWAPQVNNYYSTHVQARSGGNNRPDSVKANKQRDDRRRDPNSHKQSAEAGKTDTPKADKPLTDYAEKNGPKSAEKPESNDPGCSGQQKPQAETKITTSDSDGSGVVVRGFDKSNQDESSVSGRTIDQ